VVEVALHGAAGDLDAVSRNRVSWGIEMKPPNSLSDQELRAYADEHLQYEFDMLIWSAGILAPLAAHHDHGYLPWSLNNAVLNTFSVHARNLISFLYSRSQRKDRPTDILIEDYIDEEILEEHLPPITPLLEEAITKANKQVAHMTLERVDYEKEGKAWKFIDVANDIVAAFQSIAPHFPDPRISTELRDKLSRSGLIIPAVKADALDDIDGFPSGGTLSLIRRSQDRQK